ncbi:hypothetical protein [Desulfosporosinus sp. FKB]|uniref:hypothetical protein n=1 Tax=Desulfosporosinus sp. FKB TaxID=1969835 RepID=UPI000B4A3246|nr:hypothetical protein [Desulfosporosinus sp. FKB]
MISLLEKFSDPAVKTTINFIEKNHYESIYSILMMSLIVFFLLGYVISWIIGNKKLKREIAKLDIETKEKKLACMDKIQKSRKEYYNKSQLIQLGIAAIIDAQKTRDSTILAKAWDELNFLFLNDFLISFSEYIEMVDIDITNSKQQKLNFIDNDIFRLFKTIVNIYNTINDPLVLEHAAKPKMKISKETVINLINFVDNNIFFWNLSRKRILNKFLVNLEIAEIRLFGLRRKYIY